jgi:hypothetical protein
MSAAVLSARTMTSEIVTMTPDLARMYLERNVDNVPVVQSKVDRYAEMMATGRWPLTHQGIAFDEFLHMIDGQHRCLAVIKAGVSVQMFVTFNVPRETFAYIDQGRARGAGQVLRVRNGNLVAAILRVVWRVERGVPLTSGRVNVSPDEVLAMFARYPEVEVIASRVHQANRILTPSVHGGLLLQAWHSPHKGRIDEWLEAVVDGVGLGAKSPVLHLRNRFILTPGNKLGLGLSYVLMVKAWNAFVVGREVGVLKFNPAETAPAVLGFTAVPR